jgi:hypothetical protein
MLRGTSAWISRLFICLLLLYCSASLLHFSHNAEHLADYPNMPKWLSRSQVYVAWLGITAVGILGLLFLRFGYQRIGLMIVGLYAALGFDGLGHYALAPVSGHTIVMNATIWFEVAAGAMLLAVTVMLIANQFRASPIFRRHDAKP